MNKKSYRLHGSSIQNSTKKMMKELKEYDDLNKL